jgi:hypothetical protein
MFQLNSINIDIYKNKKENEIGFEASITCKSIYFIKYIFIFIESV